MPLKRKDFYDLDRHKHKWLIFISFLILVILMLLGMVKSKIHNSHIQPKSKVSKQIEAVIIGPIAGEYGYEIQPLLGNNNGKPINSYSGTPEKATIVGVIEKLKQDYPNLKKVGLMVGWYGDSIDAGKIKIVPKVVSRSGLEWRVAEYDRNSANLVNIGVNDKPTWTGTPTDKSVVELCRTLKKTGLSVTIYPMLFLDIPEKLWRGKVRGHSNTDIRHFFEEYDKFILHYASLNHEGSWLKDNIEGFIVGSELEGLTNYYDKHNNFLAVDHLVELAGKVRKIVGSSVKISYAANWSEYHHSTGGWYHLDKLWADPNIDFVGIDGYFPLTSHTDLIYGKNGVTISDIKQGWETGEAYEYYIENGVRKKLSPEWAIANFEYWWKNFHINPDGSVSPWRPRMKPIIFTELGFAAINKTTHAPYKYLDISSHDGGLPEGSDGTIDPKYQYDAILATISFLRELTFRAGNEEMIAGIFWYNVDPKGQSSEWEHNHELKVADYEDGNFDRNSYPKKNYKLGVSKE